MQPCRLYFSLFEHNYIKHWRYVWLKDVKIFLSNYGQIIYRYPKLYVLENCLNFLTLFILILVVYLLKLSRPVLNAIVRRNAININRTALIINSHAQHVNGMISFRSKNWYIFGRLSDTLEQP